MKINPCDTIRKSARRLLLIVKFSRRRSVYETFDNEGKSSVSFFFFNLSNFNLGIVIGRKTRKIFRILVFLLYIVKRNSLETKGNVPLGARSFSKYKVSLGVEFTNSRATSTSSLRTGRIVATPYSTSTTFPRWPPRCTSPSRETALDVSPSRRRSSLSLCVIGASNDAPLV